ASVGMETPTTHSPKRHSFTNTLITISLQLLLWSSLFPLSVQVSLFGLSKIDKSLFLADVICIAAAGTSILVVLLHTLVARLQDKVFSRWAKVAAAIFKVTTLFFSCIAVLLWITTVGLSIIFAFARQPTCRPASYDTHDMWRKGSVCYAQRAALVVSMLAFIVSFVLCFTYNVSHDPFAAGLFGPTQTGVCLTKSDLGRTTPMVNRHSTLSFKCRSMLSPIAISSPIRISSPLRAMMNANDEKSARPLSIDKSPLLSKTPSPLHSATSSIDSVSGQPPAAYIQSARYQPSRVPTAYVPSPHGTHLYSPKHLPKAIVSAMSADLKPPTAAAAAYPPQRAPTLPKIAPAISYPAPSITPIQTTSLYTSRRVSSMFMTPTAHMAPPLINKTPSSERKLDTFASSPLAHMPPIQPKNLYSTRRAPTPYVPYKPATPAPSQVSSDAPRRFPVASAYAPSSVRVPSSLLQPPPSIRRLRSADRGVSYASNTSSIYSRLPTDDK
ncbi:hypothetical protein M436DRAFT_43303, partial [Aureobasidium namibiae CBS 147.97]